ncbi:hypothetical protein EQV77_12140 [Halobacillus fulvus]|nr:hypothetical protein EQV77_12140 [Halobacillus fulvus]
MMEFLYFPDDKSEYIPAIMTLLIFLVAAAVTMILIIKSSQKEEKKHNDLYSEYRKESEDHRPGS